MARALYGRWRSLAPSDRERLQALAHNVREGALDVRGALDRRAAERDLESANRELAGAIVESASVDPEVDRAELARLRAELARELERLASADITAARSESRTRSDRSG